MERRLCKRQSVNIPLTAIAGSTYVYGHIVDLSDNGFCAEVAYMPKTENPDFSLRIDRADHKVHGRIYKRFNQGTSIFIVYLFDRDRLPDASKTAIDSILNGGTAWKKDVNP